MRNYGANRCRASYASFPSSYSELSAGGSFVRRGFQNLLLVVLVVLVRQHIRAHSTCHEPTYGAQDATAELVTEEGTASASDQSGAEATVALCRASGSSRSSVLGLAVLVMLAVLPLVLLDLLVLPVALVAVSLLGRRAIVLLLLLLWRVRRVGAVLVVPLVVVGGRGAIALLRGRVRRLRGRVGALEGRQHAHRQGSVVDSRAAAAAEDTVLAPGHTGRAAAGRTPVAAGGSRGPAGRTGPAAAGRGRRHRRNSRSCSYRGLYRVWWRWKDREEA